MKISKFIFLYLSIFFIYSCSSEVESEFIGEYEFIGEFTNTVNGIAVYDNPHRWCRNLSELMNICTDFSDDYLNVIESCIPFKESRSELQIILKEHDIFCSTFPLKVILLDSKYTRRDACDYLSEQIIEVVLDKSEAPTGKIYVYKIKGKGKYRTILCP